MTQAAVFLLATTVGGALLAIWLDARFPSLAPARLGARLLALGVACAVANVGSRFVDWALGAPVGAVPPGLLALAVVLPGLMLSFLAGIWLMRSLQDVSRAR